MKIDLGGVGQHGEWITINADAGKVRPSPDIVADITAHAHQLGDYLEPDSVDEMRCIHTLEHLPAWDIENSLKYWKTFLKPQGKLFIVVPDLGMMALDYADGRIPMVVFASVAYVPGSRTKYGVGEEHRWGWDDDSLIQMLVRCGYTFSQITIDGWYPSSWLLDFEETLPTGLVGKYEVPNLMVVGVKP